MHSRPVLDLGPVTRLLEAREDDGRAGMTLSTSDVRALVDQVGSLRQLVDWQRQQARLVHMALLEDDVALADECARRVADDAQLTATGHK